jgi:hypothetical protein
MSTTAAVERGSRTRGESPKSTPSGCARTGRAAISQTTIKEDQNATSRTAT